MFLKEVSSAHQGCNLFDLKYNKNSNIVKYYYNLQVLIYVVIYLKYIYFCDA